MRIVFFDQQTCIIIGLVTLLMGVVLVFFSRRVQAVQVKIREGSSTQRFEAEPTACYFSMGFGVVCLCIAAITLSAGILHLDLLNHARLVPIGDNKAVLLKP